VLSIKCSVRSLVDQVPWTDRVSKDCPPINTSICVDVYGGNRRYKRNTYSKIVPVQPSITKWLEENLADNGIYNNKKISLEGFHLSGRWRIIWVA